MAICIENIIRPIRIDSSSQNPNFEANNLMSTSIVGKGWLPYVADQGPFSLTFALQQSFQLQELLIIVDGIYCPRQIDVFAENADNHQVFLFSIYFEQPVAQNQRIKKTIKLSTITKSIVAKVFNGFQGEGNREGIPGIVGFQIRGSPTNLEQYKQKYKTYIGVPQFKRNCNDIVDQIEIIKVDVAVDKQIQFKSSNKEQFGLYDTAFKKLEAMQFTIEKLEQKRKTNQNNVDFQIKTTKFFEEIQALLQNDYDQLIRILNSISKDHITVHIEHDVIQMQPPEIQMSDDRLIKQGDELYKLSDEELKEYERQSKLRAKQKYYEINQKGDTNQSQHMNATQRIKERESYLFPNQQFSIDLELNKIQSYWEKQGYTPHPLAAEHEKIIEIVQLRQTKIPEYLILLLVSKNVHHIESALQFIANSIINNSLDYEVGIIVMQFIGKSPNQSLLFLTTSLLCSTYLSILKQFSPSFSQLVIGFEFTNIDDEIAQSISDKRQKEKQFRLILLAQMVVVSNASIFNVEELENFVFNSMTKQQLQDYSNTILQLVSPYIHRLNAQAKWIWNTAVYQLATILHFPSFPNIQLLELFFKIEQIYSSYGIPKKDLTLKNKPFFTFVEMRTIAVSYILKENPQLLTKDLFMVLFNFISWIFDSCTKPEIVQSIQILCVLLYHTDSDQFHLLVNFLNSHIHSNSLMLSYYQSFALGDKDRGLPSRIQYNQKIVTPQYTQPPTLEIVGSKCGFCKFKSQISNVEISHFDLQRHLLLQCPCCCVCPVCQNVIEINRLCQHLTSCNSANGKYSLQKCKHCEIVFDQKDIFQHEEVCQIPYRCCCLCNEQLDDQDVYEHYSDFRNCISNPRVVPQLIDVVESQLNASQ